MSWRRLVGMRRVARRWLRLFSSIDGKGPRVRLNLNPIVRRIAETPETSDYTGGLKDRLTPFERVREDRTRPARMIGKRSSSGVARGCWMDWTAN